MDFLKKHSSLLFFVMGFLFDLVSLQRIDQAFFLIQQGASLVLIAILLCLSFLRGNKLISDLSPFNKGLKYQKILLHFLFGSLLSAFTIFYFKSSSIITSFAFLSLILALLIINELPRFHNLGLRVKFSLFTLCLISYFSCLTPIVLGYMGVIPLFISVILVFAVIIGLVYLLDKPQIDKKIMQQTITLPCFGVLLSFLILYFFRLIPPVPLSVKHMGIYHNISRAKTGEYILSYNRSPWKFWQNGAQDFTAIPGDKIYCFASIFSPTSFKDKIFFHWSKKINGDWKLTDRIPITISGGRDQGFRAYSHKSQFEDGQWLVQVKTSDGFEMSRIYFDVNSSEERAHPQKNDFY